MMNTKETYERMDMIVTEFSSEDVISTSGEIPEPVSTTPPSFTARKYEMPIGF